MWQSLADFQQPMLSAFKDAQSLAPAWAVSIIVLVCAALAALLLHTAILAVVRHVVGRERPWLRTLVAETKNPTRVALLLFAVALALPAAPLGPETTGAILRLLLLATICLIGWVATTVLHIGANLYLMRFQIDTEDNLMARKHLTQVRVLVRVLDTVIIIVTAGFALMTFDTVRQYGVSLFASAGVAGIVAGLAARPVLSNLLAGVQLAVTQPIRLEDAVTVENEYGFIEEINSTYVVIRLWDQRRMVVPLNYFMEKPFYNWTRRTAATIGSVVLYLDYAAPIDRIRDKAAEYVAASKDGDAKLINVQVTNASPQAIEVRALVSTNSAGATSDLTAELREKLIGFLQREHPEALPRQRNEDVEPKPRKSGGQDNI